MCKKLFWLFTTLRGFSNGWIDSSREHARQIIICNRVRRGHGHALTHSTSVKGRHYRGTLCTHARSVRSVHSWGTAPETAAGFRRGGETGWVLWRATKGDGLLSCARRNGANRRRGSPYLAKTRLSNRSRAVRDAERREFSVPARS